MREIFGGRGGRSRWRVAAAVVAAGMALPVVAAVWRRCPALATLSYGPVPGSAIGRRTLPRESTWERTWTTCGRAGPEGGDFSVSAVRTSDYGFQCTELANRFLWDATSRLNDLDAQATTWSGATSPSPYTVTHTSIPLVSSGTKTLPSAGDIISMQGTAKGNPYGHVAIVTGFTGTVKKGQIQLLEENGSSSGTNDININNGQMTYGSPSYDYGCVLLHLLPVGRASTPRPPGRADEPERLLGHRV